VRAGRVSRDLTAHLAPPPRCHVRASRVTSGGCGATRTKRHKKPRRRISRSDLSSRLAAIPRSIARRWLARSKSTVRGTWIGNFLVTCESTWGIQRPSRSPDLCCWFSGGPAGCTSGTRWKRAYNDGNRLTRRSEARYNLDATYIRWCGAIYVTVHYPRSVIASRSHSAIKKSYLFWIIFVSVNGIISYSFAFGILSFAGFPTFRRFYVQILWILSNCMRLKMIINIFRIFDPSTCSSFLSNWIKLIIVFILIPFLLWVCQSRYEIYIFI